MTCLQDDFVDFKEVRDADTHLFVDNDSKYRSQLMTGAGVKLFDLSRARIDLVLAVEFREGGQPVLDGGFLGGGVSLKCIPHIVLVGGLSRSSGKELTHGFRRSMGKFIKDNRDNSVDYPRLKEINLQGGVINDLRGLRWAPAIQEEFVD